MPNTRDPKRSLGFLLTETARLIRRNFDRRVQPLGLTQTQWRAIAHLKHNEGIKQASLAEILEVQPITLARLIDRMERDGWVERRPDPCDRRAVQLFLTDQVEPVVSQMWELAALTRQEAMAGLSDEVLEQLIETLAIIKQNLSQAEAGSDESTDTKQKQYAKPK
jgi:DNA-binding MarR family transcriptional regulator